MVPKGKPEEKHNEYFYHSKIIIINNWHTSFQDLFFLPSYNFTVLKIMHKTASSKSDNEWKPYLGKARLTWPTAHPVDLCRFSHWFSTISAASFLPSIPPDPRQQNMLRKLQSLYPGVHKTVSIFTASCTRSSYVSMSIHFIPSPTISSTKTSWNRMRWNEDIMKAFVLSLLPIWQC